MLDIANIRKSKQIQDTILHISLDWLSGDIQILKNDTETIEIIQYAKQGFLESKLFDAQVENGVLNIVDGRKRKLCLGINFHRTMLELRLPPQLFQSFSIQSTGSHVTIEDLQVVKCSCRITSGKAHIAGTFANLDVRAVGSHIMGERLAVQKLHLQATSSTASFSGSFSEIDSQITGRSINMLSSSMIQRLQSISTGASVKVSVPENDGFILQYKKNSGQMHSDFPLVSQGNEHTYKRGGSTFIAEVRGGKFTILRN
ncbi:DUF4097 family beta strand repeat-containing protein [Paenibacillus sp. KQZ6P-2]|uniref:DUF4097 family beta strand repeat-containing protein n=1 Tax=Paenibacillus mangrovi TaxID=2931978 RepID=A0A9X1WKS0_9BACL|nr:DUF4097 family beta strand repeat-containing protein [Paenibacillus mangrovi]MCJ8010793.1 DUF4097 family beta strand repeat-containing protein [Paenibacillus mangrovi]